MFWNKLLNSQLFLHIAMCCTFVSSYIIPRLAICVQLISYTISWLLSLARIHRRGEKRKTEAGRRTCLQETMSCSEDVSFRDESARTKMLRKQLVGVDAHMPGPASGNRFGAAVNAVFFVEDWRDLRSTTALCKEVRHTTA